MLRLSGGFTTIGSRLNVGYSSCYSFPFKPLTRQMFLVARCFLAHTKGDVRAIVWRCAWRILKPETTRERYFRNTNRA